MALICIRGKYKCKAKKSKIVKLEQKAEQIEKENAQMRIHLAKINAKLK